MTDTPARLVRLAQQLEDQHAPQHMTILMRNAAKRHRARRLGLYLDAILADLIEHHGVNKTRKLLLEYVDQLKEFDSGHS